MGLVGLLVSKQVSQTVISDHVYLFSLQTTCVCYLYRCYRSEFLLYISDQRYWRAIFKFPNTKRQRHTSDRISTAEAEAEGGFSNSQEGH